MEKIILPGLLPDEITESLNLQQKFRGLQIFKWIGSGITSFDQMTNLSKDVRQMLSERAVLRSSKVTQTLKDPDGTIKLQITLSDGRAVETVLLTDKEGRKTACVAERYLTLRTGCERHGRKNPLPFPIFEAVTYRKSAPD